MVGYLMEELYVWLVIRWKSSMYGWLSDGRAPCMVGYQMEELYVGLVRGHSSVT